MTDQRNGLRLALVLAWSAACGDREPSIASATSFLSQGEPIYLSLTSEDELSRWRLRSGISGAHLTSEGLNLRLTREDPHLSRALTPPAHGIARLQIRTLEPEDQFKIYFRVNGRESEDASVVAVPSPADPRVQTAEIPPDLFAGYPIGGIRLDPSSEDKELTLVSLALTPTGGDTLLEIAGDARRCVRTQSAKSSIYAPDGAFLHLGIGVFGSKSAQQSARLWGRVLGRDGSVVRSIERSVNLERSAWVDVLAEVPPSDEPLDLDLSLLGTLDGVVLESCYEEPVVSGLEPTDRPNVLLISLDTLRSDHLEHAPVMSRLAREGRSFSRMWSSSSWTLPSHVSLLTSLPVSEHTVPHLGDRNPFPSTKLSNDVVTLPAVLRQAGYFTGASTDGGFVGLRFGFSNGFDRFRTPPGSMHLESWKSRHVSFLKDMVRDRGTRPFFALVHSYKAHDYFLNTSDYHDYVRSASAELRERGSLLEAIKSRVTSDPLTGTAAVPDDYLRALYAAGVRRVDELVDELVNVVLRETSDAPLLVVITSDHGESFEEHRNVWHHGTSLYEEQIRVPLIAWSNVGGELTGNSRAPSSTIDVAPSILRWLGLPVPAAFAGQSDRFLPQPLPDRKIPVEASMSPVVPIGMERIDQALIEGDWKYVRSDSYDGRLLGEQCFQLESDPREDRDWMGRKSECERFRSLFAKLLRRSRSAVLVESSAPVRFLTRGLREHGRGLVAVRSSDPTSEPIALLEEGSIQWTPSAPDGVLAVIPSQEGLVFDRVFVGDVPLAEAIELEEVGSAASPLALDSRGAKVVMFRHSLHAIKDPSESEGEAMDPELLDQLRALGYLGK